jgi:hypothetical protein
MRKSPGTEVAYKASVEFPQEKNHVTVKVDSDDNISCSPFVLSLVFSVLASKPVLKLRRHLISACSENRGLTAPRSASDATIWTTSRFRYLGDTVQLRLEPWCLAPSSPPPFQPFRALRSCLFSRLVAGTFRVNGSTSSSRHSGTKERQYDRPQCTSLPSFTSQPDAHLVSSNFQELKTVTSSCSQNNRDAWSIFHCVHQSQSRCINVRSLHSNFCIFPIINCSRKTDFHRRSLSIDRQ